MNADWHSLWKNASEVLGNANEARFLVEHVSGLPQTAWANSTPTDVQNKGIREAVERRLFGEPLQYVLGEWPFLDVILKVDQRALIPRPETEELVALVVNALPAGARVLDLGTGSGAIAIAIAHQRSDVHVVAVDASTDALALAQENANAVGVNDRIEFLHGSWFNPLPEGSQSTFDLVITNPPYVPGVDRPSLDKSVVGWEPESALFAGDDGLDDLRLIVASVNQWLAPGGMFCTELAPQQANSVIDLCAVNGLVNARAVHDMTKRPRFVFAHSSRN